MSRTLDREGANSREAGIPAPPRALMGCAFFLLLIVVVAGVGVFLFITGGRRISSLIPLGMIVAVALPILTLFGAVLFRRSLPRRLWIGVLAFWVLVGIIAAVGGTYAYREALPPRYQEEMLTYAPFMRAFMRPTPAGGIVPTIAVTGGMNPADLLSMQFGNTPTPAAVEATAEVTVEPTVTPTLSEITPTQTAPPTQAPITPTEAAMVPTVQPTLAPTVDPLSVSSTIDRPSNARIYGVQSYRQTWNTCGPTNITQALSYYGWQEDQSYAIDMLKPVEEDKNVSPMELVNFVNTQTGVRAISRIGGNLELLKQFLAAGFPVLVETSITFEGGDWTGHYQTLVAYDDNYGIFYVYDTWLGSGVDGSGIAEEYQDFDRDWQAFNRVFIVVYEQGRESEVQQILGPLADVNTANQNALTVAQNEARENPQDAFAYFNMGTALTRLGEYEAAASAYTRSISLRLPFRMLWYQFGPFEAYFNAGWYDDLLGLVQSNLTTGGEFVEETHYWQARVYEERGQQAEAVAAYQRALDQNPNYQAARDGLARLG